LRFLPADFSSPAPGEFKHDRGGNQAAGADKVGMNPTPARSAEQGALRVIRARI